MPRKIVEVLSKSLKNFGFFRGGEKVCEFLLFFKYLTHCFRYGDQSREAEFNMFSEFEHEKGWYPAG